MRFFSRNVLFVASVLILTFSSAVKAQSAAVLVPDPTEAAQAFATELEKNLRERHTIVDSELAAAALKARNYGSPFNMTNVEARYLGNAIGSPFYVLVRGGSFRRSTFRRKKFFEAFAALYVVESRTGDLISWRLFNAEEDEADSAYKTLISMAPAAASLTIQEIGKRIGQDPDPNKEIDKELPTPSEYGFRPPMPYRRLKPEYTRTADQYGIEATVDIEVSIDQTGKVATTRIVRWAGFGLDESVEKTVRAMNWRAADRKGTNFAMTVLLRYNFKDLDNEDLSQ